MIMQRFPDNMDEIRQLYLTDQSFQVICHDYQKCTEVLANYNGTDLDIKRNDRIQNDYQELIASLEAEILELITACEQKLRSDQSLQSTIKGLKNVVSD